MEPENDEAHLFYNNYKHLFLLEHDLKHRSYRLNH